MPYGIFNSARVAVEHDGLIALAKRTYSGEQGGMYEIFGGKIEDGETALAAAVRETHEELGKELDFLTLAPIECKPYEINRGKNAGRKCRVYGFAAVADSIDLQLDPAEHILGSEIWVRAQDIEDLPGVTQATVVAMRSLKSLF